jgi:polyhydroxyalkanoate synthesis regulator phasin
VERHLWLERRVVRRYPHALPTPREDPMLKENPMFKKMFELGEEQVGKLAQQLLSNEKFVNAMQTIVGNTLKAKGLMDKNIRMALSAMNLPSVADMENLKKKLDELEETIQRLEESVTKMGDKK